MGCRLATKEDRPHFLKLWTEYLDEHREAGSSLVPCDQNLKVFRDLFDAYLTGQLAGVTVFWEPDEATAPEAVVMGGEDFGSSPWVTDYAKLATIWGVYVRPEYRGKRLGLEMEKFGESSLLRFGFDAAKSTVRFGNELGEANWRHWDGHRGVIASEAFIIADLGEK